MMQACGVAASVRAHASAASIVDAVMGFDFPDDNLSARAIFDVSMTHLRSDFADIFDSHEIIAPFSE